MYAHQLPASSNWFVCVLSLFTLQCNLLRKYQQPASVNWLGGICCLLNTLKETYCYPPCAPWWRSTLTSPVSLLPAPGMSALADLRQLNFGGFGDKNKMCSNSWQCMLLILIFIGTVSATYGTLIVLAISFAIAAIGNILTLPSLITSKTRGHTGMSYTLLLSGALLYYGLLSMRERRYSSSQYYPRYFVLSLSLVW